MKNVTNIIPVRKEGNHMVAPFVTKMREEWIEAISVDLVMEKFLES